MRTSLRMLATVLVLGAALLPGCKKSKATNADQGGGGPSILPGIGQVPQGGGAVQEVRRAGQRTVDLLELENFALAYFQYKSENNRPPAGLDDIKDSVSKNLITAFQEGHCVAIWKVRDYSSNVIVAYTKEPDPSGRRRVAAADGKARLMSKEEFEAALKEQR